jgi:hypothetical protein
MGDYVLNAPEAGSYTFCFDNFGPGVSAGEKKLEFELLQEDDPLRASLPLPHPLDAAKHGAMEESLFNIKFSLSKIRRDQLYFRSRENRNMDTVITTEARMAWGAVVSALLVVAMGTIQVYIIRNLFVNKNKSSL